MKRILFNDLEVVGLKYRTVGDLMVLDIGLLNEIYGNY